jgi:hypothetical protein
MGGLFEMYTKKEMREKFKVRSPNCADVLMMSERIHGIIEPETNLDSIYQPTVSHW